ncbi:unnamed protein product [Camellia sinensis]
MGWLRMKLSTNQIKKFPKMLVVDCEMVLFEDGTEALVRVCAVGRNLQVKLNELVNPNKAVADYRSESTGLSAEDLDGVTCSLANVQESMKKLLRDGKTILIGHSLNNDLKALKLDYGRVIDTSLIFKHGDEANFRRPSLNDLCKWRRREVRTMKVQRGGNRWLSESAVARVKIHLSAADLKDEIRRRGYGDIKVQIEGEEWEEGMVFEQVRQVWISCYGVPLILWNNNTFCNIGREWGEVLEMDEDTINLSTFHYGKVKIETRLKEQCICQSFMRNNEVISSFEEVENTVVDRGSRQEEEDDDVAVHVGVEVAKGCVVAEGDRQITYVCSNDMDEETRLRELSVVESSELMMGGLEEGTARKDGSIRRLCLGEPEGGGARKEDSCRGDDEVFKSGFIKSLSGPVGLQQGINLEVDLNRAHLESSKEGSAQWAENSSNWANHSLHSITKQVNRVEQPKALQNKVNSAPIHRNKLKEIGEASRRQKTLKQWKHKEGKRFLKSTTNLRKGAVFRSAVAALSLSLASKSSRGCLRISEAESSIQIGKVLGVDCDGNEGEVMSKLEELEATNKRKEVRRGGEEN